MGTKRLLGALVLALAVAGAASEARAATATLTVAGTQWGQSTCYIGATEGSVRFDPADLRAAGVNTYRVYGSVSRWEYQDDDGVFGAPSIAEIKGDPNAVNWAWWDNAMTSPPSGSDYWWTQPANTNLLWHGNARTIFAGLRQEGVRTVLTLRPTDNNGNPFWASSLNPPTTTAAWNEWWEHVFAIAYWLNVRNDYRVDDYEVHNEPNNASQGWKGTITQYYELVRQTKNALDYVYSTYLPGRTPWVHAPTTTGGSSWPSSILQNAGDSFNAVNVHNYDADISPYTQKVHDWMNRYGHATSPLWIGEWATYDLGNYDQASFNVNNVITNLIRGSRPGNDYVYGNHLFSFYDWRSGRTGQYVDFDGLVQIDGTRRPVFYAMRLATRALQGCRPTFQTTASTSDLTAITTKDDAGNVYTLVTNSSVGTPYTVDLNLATLLAAAGGTVWRYSATDLDTVVASPSLVAGHTTLDVPPTSAVLVQFGTAVPPPPPPPPGDTTAPAAPAALLVTATGESRVDLDWGDNSEPDLAGYRVYRSTTADFTPSLSNRVATGVTSSVYADSGALPATTYFYKVTAVDTTGNESPPSSEVTATTPEATGVVEPGNLALGKSVTVSSSHADVDKYGGPKAVDGDSRTRWWTLKDSPLPTEQIVVDLGGSKSVSKVVVNQGDRWAKAYSIQVSSNGSGWTTVHSTTTGAKGIATITFPPIGARYVKMESTAWLYANDRLKLYELDVYSR